MSTTLGLDLGSNSIGWAVRNTAFEGNNQIIAYGTKIFEEGIKLIPSSKAAERTSFRRMRLGYFRRRLRKYDVLLLQITKKMCPLTFDELQEWLKPKKGKKPVFPTNVLFLNWLALDFNNDGVPDYKSIYELRAKAIEHSGLTLMELGRIFYSMCLHRGYKSNKIEDPLDESDMEEDENKKNKKATEKSSSGDERKLVLGSIKKIEEKLNGRTLGQYINNDMFESSIDKVRGMHFSREQLIEEFERIAVANNLDKAIKEEMFQAIFFQRKLKSQKRNVGSCLYEKKKYRCPISHPLFEKYRMWSFINNIRHKKVDDDNNIVNVPLSQEEITKILPLFFRKGKPTFHFIEIIEVLYGKIKDDKELAKKMNYNPNKSVSGCPTIAALKNVLGDDYNNMKEFSRQSAEVKPDEAQKGEISIEAIWNALFFFDDTEKLKEWAINKLNLNEKKASAFSKIVLKSGYANLSKKAIKKILPYLENGVIYSQAVIFANLPEVVGQSVFDKNVDKLNADIRSIILGRDLFGKLVDRANKYIGDKRKQLEEEHLQPLQFVSLSEFEVYDLKQEIQCGINEILEKHIAKEYTMHQDYDIILNDFNKILDSNATHLKFLKVPRLMDIVENYLKNTFGVSDEDLKKLYHPSDIEVFPLPDKSDKGIPLLPKPETSAIKNPVFNRAMYELKSLINYLLRKDVITPNTRINIEFGREFNSNNMRKAITNWQLAREAENLEFAKRIKEHFAKENINREPSDTEIDKYRLWEEQQKKCLYTGKTISLKDLFSPENKFEIEHTLPRSKTLNNGLENKTICDAYFNRQVKKNEIPSKLANYNKESSYKQNGNNIVVPPIMQMVDSIYLPIINSLESKISTQKLRSKNTSTKEQRDNAIVERHKLEIDLDYYKAKYKSFIITELPDGFKRSQSTDISLINKYAAQYLRTVFDNVRIYSSIVLSDIKKKWGIAGQFEKKDRSMHSHHTIDAITLTFINYKLNEQLSNLYKNAEKHPDTSSLVIKQPFYNFNKWILGIKDSIIVKRTNKDYTLKQTKRKRRNESGRIMYKSELDSKGNKIPIVKRGFGIRGSLHQDTFYAAIQTGDEIKYAVRKPLNNDTFKSISDFDKIVDERVRDVVKQTVKERLESGSTFKNAIEQEIYLNEGKGIRINKVRIFASKISNPMKIKEHLVASDNMLRDHKRYYYVNNDSNYLYCSYTYSKNNKSIRDAYTFSLKEIADLKKQNISYEKYIEKKKQVEDVEILFIIKNGTHVIFYENTPDEINWDSNADLNKRLYYVISSEIDGRVRFRYHLEARSDDKLKEDLKSQLGSAYVNTLVTGQSKFDYSKTYSKLRLSKGNHTFLIEGKDFIINQDGTIERL